MIVVADASVLVAELLRRRGRELLSHPALQVMVSEQQWDETVHELRARLTLLIERGKLTVSQAEELWAAVVAMQADGAIEVVPAEVYAHNEATARRRVPRDAGDWPVVALALALTAGILTGDDDFLGCGCPTWTVETLRAELDAEGELSN